jgi:hypothetical protein
VKFDSKSTKEVPFEFNLNRASDLSKLVIVVFVQDVASGEVHQSAVIPVATKP